ncbi:MAG TPA: DUF2652 domain-containing protein [Chitinophagaceae bacterium]|nr:DUF2652 domain-containing protein [Chitinophagaceae bacterium]
MENKGLLFIPDISGFTRFVNETDIDHSRLIIQELLELLINANDTGLEVSEVEGDAILFYKFGKPPDLEALYKQVEKMFCAFHRHLAVYDFYRFCQCKACVSAINLSLKIITHYGEFTSYSVKSFNKLIGKDIIVAHQLLKNDIEQHEYWLVTKNLLPGEQPGEFTNWMIWNDSVRQTENGNIPFSYTQLSELKKKIEPELLPQPQLSKKVKTLSFTDEYETDIITLFHATGDFNIRNRWQEGVVAVEAVSHFLPRVGMRCHCIKEDGQAGIYSSSYSYTPERIEFSETDEKEKTTTYYTLEKKGASSTKLTIDFYIKKNIVSQIKFNLWEKKKLEDNFHKSLQKLHGLVTALNQAN